MAAPPGAVRDSAKRVICSLFLTECNGGCGGKLTSERPASRKTEASPCEGVFSEFSKRITLFLQRNSRVIPPDNPPSTELCLIFSDFRAVRGCGGIIAVPVSNSVVKTTEFEELAAVWSVPRLRRRAGVFLDHALPRRMHGRSRGRQGCFSL